MGYLALTVAFLLEIAAFIGFGAISRFLPYSNLIQNISFAILLLVVLIFWAVFMAPRAPMHLQGVSYYSLKILVYLIATAGIVRTASPAWGVLFLIAFVVDELLILWLRPKRPQHTY